MNWFKKLLASKISITIVVPAEVGVQHSTVPRVVENPASVLKRKKLSNVRFVTDSEISHTGKETTWYFTQAYINHDWSMVPNSLSQDKKKAMELHLKIIEQGSIEPKTTRTVLWEGLSKEETETWIGIQ